MVHICLFNYEIFQAADRGPAARRRAALKAAESQQLQGTQVQTEIFRNDMEVKI
jgi:hypothetical protein